MTLFHQLADFNYYSGVGGIVPGGKLYTVYVFDSMLISFVSATMIILSGLILEEGNPAGAETVATFIVDVGAQGLPANTETNLHFALHPEAVRLMRCSDGTLTLKA